MNFFNAISPVFYVNCMTFKMISWRDDTCLCQYPSLKSPQKKSVRFLAFQTEKRSTNTKRFSKSFSCASRYYIFFKTFKRSLFYFIRNMFILKYYRSIVLMIDRFCMCSFYKIKKYIIFAINLYYLNLKNQNYEKTIYFIICFSV